MKKIGKAPPKQSSKSGARSSTSKAAPKKLATTKSTQKKVPTQSNLSQPPTSSSEPNNQQMQEIDQPKLPEKIEQPQQKTEVSLPQEINRPTFTFNPFSISSFCDLQDFDLDEYILSDAPFLTFEGISNLRNAKRIFVKNALFTSFKYTSKMPNLKKCSFSGSPVFYKKNYRIMILLAFGEQIDEIDDAKVTFQEKQIFKCFNDESLQLLSEYIQNGGIITQNIDEKLIEELNLRKNNPAPHFCLPIKSKPLNHMYYTPFLNETEIRQLIDKEIRNIYLEKSSEIIEDKEQLFLLSKIQNEVFNLTNQNKLLNQFKSNEIFSKNDIENIEKVAFSFITDALNTIKNQLQESKQQISSFEIDNNYSCYFYKSVMNILVEAYQKTDTILEKISLKEYSLSSAIKIADSYYNILNRKSSFIPIFNFLQENYHQLINLLSSYLIISPSKDLIEIDDTQIQSLLKEIPRPNYTRLIEVINNLEDNEKKKILIEKNIVERLQDELNAKAISETALKNLKKASIYITLIERCPKSQYFSSFAAACHTLTNLCEQIPNLVNDQNKQKILHLFSEIENFINSVVQNYSQIIKANQLIPKYSDIKSLIDQAIGNARIHILKFEIEKANAIKDKISKILEGRNESKIKMLEIAKKVEIMFNFIHETFIYQDINEKPFLINDLSSFGEEFVQSKDPARRQQIQEELKEINDESDAKDKEIQALFAQCTELGIDVEQYK
ncbi:hypothetical protein M9Y10_004734 [Tritrichomonas musculus]|uniref:Uncharacterized protein n=1 Tax=Tritrichomonas musculus TaxID=1915356 RepID=A0ABR2JJT4_9EUKA